jgi:PAS domain S-box-containing protein
MTRSSAQPGQDGAEAAETAETAELRAQLREALETIEAIRGGGVDSLVIGLPGQEQVYTVASADRTYRLIVEAMSEGAATISPRGVVLDVNPRLSLMTGQPSTQLIGASVLDLIPGASRPELARLLEVGAGGSSRGEVELNGPDGTTVPVLLAVGGFDLDGMLLRGLVLTDLTAQRAAEDRSAAALEALREQNIQIQRAQAALRESEEWLRAVFDNAPVGIEDVSPSGEFIRVNPRFCQITGYTADELRSRRIKDITHPDDSDADLARLQRIASGEIDTDSVEKRYLRKDGEVVWAEVSYAVVRDPDGSPRLIVGVVRDLTAQRVAEAEVRTLNAGLEARVVERTAELEQANNNLEAFSYSVSHDLRAPLRTLSGYSEVLLEDYGDRLDETGRGYLGRIQAASERMATLIDDLLALSRVSRVQINLAPVDLSAEAAAIAAELQFRDPGRRVRFTIQDGIRVMADRGLIRTVLENLIENAWKFTAKDDDAIIEFGATTPEDGRVCCYVRDNGAGFDPAYAAKLFKPFERLHDAAEFPGTGIGLASVARIVERHGGRVWADGTVGGGATFYFTLAGVEGVPRQAGPDAPVLALPPG